MLRIVEDEIDPLPLVENKEKEICSNRAIMSDCYIGGLAVPPSLALRASGCRQPDAQSKELYGCDLKEKVDRMGRRENYSSQRESYVLDRVPAGDRRSAEDRAVKP